MDSFMFAGRWIEAATGIGVTSHWRGRYGSCEEACALIEDALGGPVSIARTILRAHGIERTRVPLAGDVALVVDRTIEGRAVPVAAICLDGRMRAIRTRLGVAVMPARTLIAWKLGAHG